MIRKVTRQIPMTAGITCPPDEGRPDPRDVLLRGGAVVGEPLAEVLVRLAETADRQEDVDQDEAEEHHRRDEQRVAGEERDDEDPHGILRPEPLGEPVGEPVRARLEHRRHGRRRVIVTASSRGEDAGPTKACVSTSTSMRLPRCGTG